MPGYFVDTSVWVAGSFESHPHFPLADSFLVGPQRAEAVWLARVVENSFLRLITTAVLCRSYDSPVVGNLQAVEILYHLGCLPLSVSPSIDVPLYRCPHYRCLLFVYSCLRLFACEDDKPHETAPMTPSSACSKT